jgi:hypothetical protein
MTNENRIGKFASLCLIGLGFTWIGCIAYRMTQDGLFPWQYRTVELPIVGFCAGYTIRDNGYIFNAPQTQPPKEVKGDVVSEKDRIKEAPPR